MNITTVVDQKRGCGYRKPGGLYFVGGNSFTGCCKLPFELTVCRVCGQGIKFARGFTWITSGLFSGDCSSEKIACSLSLKNVKMGLMWVGEKYYTPTSFSKEAVMQGVSKRIPSVPKDFNLGVDRIALAHRKAISRMEVDLDNGGNMVERFYPAAFMVFKPERIEYVVAEDDNEHKLIRLADRGITLVRVVYDKPKLGNLPQLEIFDDIPK